MALKVIGAGLGRTATFSLKFALEHLGFGPCYHMAEVFAGGRRNVPLWLDVVRGKPDWALSSPATKRPRTIPPARTGASSRLYTRTRK